MKFSAIIEQASDLLQGKSLSTSGVEVVNTLANLVRLYNRSGCRSIVYWRILHDSHDAAPSNPNGCKRLSP
jgi:hypothetical protein